MKWITILGVSLALVSVFGCSAPGDNSSDAGALMDPEASSAAHEVRLSVTVAREVSEIMESVPSKEMNMFAVVTLRLENGLDRAIVALPGNFRLRGDNGLETFVSPTSLRLQDGCPSDSMLARGAVLSCSLAFELGQAVTPKTLVLSTVPEPTEVLSKPVSVETPIEQFDHCSRCGAGCLDLKTNPEHCGSCQTPAPIGGSCLDGVPTCPSPLATCNGSCVDLSRDLQHCGACNTGYVDGICDEGVARCREGESPCGDVCTDLQTDSHHCGACGQSVPPNAQCFRGKPVCDDRLDLCADGCVNLDRDPDNCGACGKRCPNDFFCSDGDWGHLGQCYGRAFPDVGESCISRCKDLGAVCEKAKYYDEGQGWFEVACSVSFNPYWSSMTCWCYYP